MKSCSVKRRGCGLCLVRCHMTARIFSSTSSATTKLKLWPFMISLVRLRPCSVQKAMSAKMRHSCVD